MTGFGPYSDEGVVYEVNLLYLRFGFVASRIESGLRAALVQLCFSVLHDSAGMDPPTFLLEFSLKSLK